MNAVQTTTVVTVVDGSVTTLSTDVATFFEKPHNDVLKAIRQIVLNLPEERLGNFSQTVVTRANPSGGAPIKSKAYRLTRDGFTFLAMGFTGERAQAFKWAYIDAFNKMEAALRQCPVVHQKAIRRPINREQQYAIISAVNTKAYSACVPKSYVYTSLKNFFKVDKYTDIKADDFDLAIGFIQRLNYGNHPKAISAPESPRTLSNREIQALSKLHRFYADPYWKSCAKQALNVLRVADSPFAGKFYDLIHEPALAWITLEKFLDRNGVEHSYEA